MGNSYLYALAAMGTAGAISFFLAPISARLAWRIGAVDLPKDNRRMHKKPTPRLGGLGLFLAFLVSSLLFASPMPLVWIAAAFLFLVGLLDDVFALPAFLKLVCQTVAALVVALGRTTDFSAMLVAAFWLVLLTNAHNFLDGIDGLCLTIAAVEAAGIAALALASGNPSLALTCLILIAAGVGVLPKNAHPATLFLGDCGSTVLGFLLGHLSLMVDTNMTGALAPAVLPVLFALPLFDTFLAVLHRTWLGRSPFIPDRSHLHHLLYDAGLSQPAVVEYLGSVCAGVALVAVLLAEPTHYAFAALLCVILAFGILIENPSFRWHYQPQVG